MTENYHGVSVRSETTMTDDLKAPERTFDHPYELSHSDGEWWTLKSNGFVVASFSLKTWGSAERIIEAAWQYAYGQPDADRIATLEAALADMTRQRDAAMAGAVTVKPLMWHEGDEPDEWKSGPYDVWCELGMFQLYHWSIIVGEPHRTADNAKAAAQADYNARIISALTPDPDRLLALTAAAYEDAVSGLERDIEDREIDAARFRAGTNPHHYRMNLAQAIRYHAAQIRARIPADAISALSRIEAQAEARGMRKAADRAQEIANAAREYGHSLRMGSKGQIEIMERCWGAEDARVAISGLADATEAAAKGGV